MQMIQTPAADQITTADGSQPDSVVPNLYLVGVPKGGTTSLARWLSDHPQIMGGTEKELRILMDPHDPLSRPDGYHSTGAAAFAPYFPDGPGKARWHLDASPEYYYQDIALDAIADMPDARVIFLFRNPADRVISMFNFARFNMNVLPRDLSFAAFMAEIAKGRDSKLIGHRPMLRDAVAHGEYSRYLDLWQTRIGADRVTTLLLDDFRDAAENRMAALAGWLGIESGFYADYAFPSENESYVTRSAFLHKAMRKARRVLPYGFRRHFAPIYRLLNTSRSFEATFDDDDEIAINDLRSYYEPWNIALQELLGRDTPIWPRYFPDAS